MLFFFQVNIAVIEYIQKFEITPLQCKYKLKIIFYVYVYS